MYAKVFKSMFAGTLRGRSDALLVFINLLANCDKAGFVDVGFRMIADETGLPIERVRCAIKELESPDAESRSQDLAGRRIERISTDRSWGWRIVNYLHYRQLRDEEARREQNRQSQATFREVNGISNSKRSSSISAHAEAEVEADAKEVYCAYPRKIGRPYAIRAIKKALRAKGKEFVLERTKQYATAVATSDPKFVPYPATWFNQERFNDDPKEWSCNGHAKPSMVKPQRKFQIV